MPSLKAQTPRQAGPERDAAMAEESEYLAAARCGKEDESSLIEAVISSPELVSVPDRAAQDRDRVREIPGRPVRDWVADMDRARHPGGVPGKPPKRSIRFIIEAAIVKSLGLISLWDGAGRASALLASDSLRDPPLRSAHLDASSRSSAIPSATRAGLPASSPLRASRAVVRQAARLQPGQQTKGQIEAAHDQRSHQPSRLSPGNGKVRHHPQRALQRRAFTRETSEAIPASLKQSRKKWLTMRSNGASGNSAGSHRERIAVHQPDLRAAMAAVALAGAASCCSHPPLRLGSPARVAPVLQESGRHRRHTRERVDGSHFCHAQASCIAADRVQS